LYAQSDFPPFSPFFRGQTRFAAIGYGALGESVRREPSFPPRLWKQSQQLEETMAEDLSPEVKRLRDELRCKALGTLDLARSKLEDMLHNGEKLASDEEMRACLALLRLAPLLLKEPGVKESPRIGPLFEEGHWTPERLQALEMLQHYETETPEESAARDVRRQAKYDAWAAREHGPFKSPEEAMEHYRTHGVDNIGDMWDEFDREEYELMKRQKSKGGTDDSAGE
jgi:hypothetical protein